MSGRRRKSKRLNAARASVSPAKSEEEEKINNTKDLKGDSEMRYTDGQVVFAKYGEYPWWPGQVQLKQTDTGASKVRIRWFGDFGERVDRCTRTRIVPYQQYLVAVIRKEVNRPDLTIYRQSCKQAKRVLDEIREETGYSGDANEEDTDEQSEEEEEAEQNGQLDEHKSSRPSQRRSRRKRKSTTSSTSSTSSTSATTHGRKRKRSSASSSNSQPRRSQRVSNKQAESEAGDSRGSALEAIYSTHQAEDLSAFVSLLYYGYLEDGKSENEAITLTGEKWDIDNEGVLDHVSAFEEQKNARPKKRRRI